MTLHEYILDGHTAVPCDSPQYWAWFESADRRVALDLIGPYRVSTVFLGIDHNFSDTGEPLLFETMVFGGESEEQIRYSTWEQAEAGHREVVEKLRGRL